jgi:hypothetical protein
MLIDRPDGELFYRLHPALMFFVNQRLGALPDPLANPEEFAALPPQARLQVREAFLAHPELLRAFVEENPAHLPDDELAIAASWQHLRAGKFIIFRELAKYTVFLSTGEQPVAYGVLALAQPFEEVLGAPLPAMVEAVLLPFKDKIIYDGLLRGYRISFGPGARRAFNESYQEAKERHGIVTSLPLSDRPAAPAVAAKPRPRPKAKAKPKEDTAQVLRTIIGLIDQFCREHLNEEYAELSRKLAEKLARKRPSPLLHGKPAAWASGIVRAIGWVNFLGDKSQTPHMRLSDVDAGFGVGESTGAAKLAAIRNLLHLRPLDPRWTLPSRLDDNPLVWILKVNGLLMDIRHAPREAQVAAFEKGLIPYIPADRQQED